MKSTIQFLLLTFLAIGLMMSCKKKSDPATPSTPTTPTCMVTSIIIGNDSTGEEKIILTYDSNNRLTSSIATSSTGPSGFNFIINYTYDVNGKMIQTNMIPDSGSTINNNVYKYQYDSQGRIIQQTHLSGLKSAITWSEDSTVYVFVSASQVNKTIYTQMDSSGTMSYDTLATVIQLDADGDPVTELFRPFLSSKYNSTIFTFSRDTLIKYKEYQYYPQQVSPYVLLPLVAYGNFSLTKKIIKQIYYHDTAPKIVGGQITEELNIFENYTYNFDANSNMTGMQESVTDYIYSGIPGFPPTIVTGNLGNTNFIYTCK